jgi:hypothetical protein|tara:strand:- start:15974 stop:16354 length:381 start_codon:yes stop_codon:yes gene_type:complete
MTSPAVASDPAWFPCTSIDEKGESVDKSAFTLGTLGDFDGKSYWILQGGLDVPTSGYSYRFTLGKRTGHTQHGTITLMPPAGDAMTVIDRLGVTVRHEMHRKIDNVVINIDKTFHWGVDSVRCRLN